MMVQQHTELRSSQQTRALSPTRKGHHFLRILAVLLVLFLLGSTISLSINMVIKQTSTLSQMAGPNIEHADGKIIQIAADKSFTLKTATGQVLHFVCDKHCHASLPHLQRHRREQAHTDVYYVFDATGDRLFHALYVD